MKKFAAVLMFFGLAGAAMAADYADLLKAFQYRNLGPWRAGAWVSSLAVPESPAKAHQHVMFAGARTGGVWRTTNSGTTWEPVTDSVGITSVGAVAVAPSDANVVWVGTGDNSLTRSAYYGNGVYKSTDGGTTWTNMGLKDTQHVARIVIHPTDPNVVWIAALGHLNSPNEERGVFQTTDGGKTWKKQLYVNNTTGAVDLVVDRRDPKVLYAGMYDAIRYPWFIAEARPGGGIFKTTDGGGTWNKLAGGLPTGATGRIGMDICRKNPDILYAVVDNFTLRPGATQPSQPAFAGPSAYIGGEVYRTDDAGKTWRRASAEGEDVSRKAGYSFNQLRVDPNNPEHLFVTGSNLIGSTDGGKTWAGLGQGGGGRAPFQSTFGDFRSLWIDSEDSDHMVSTSDGGVTVSYDGGRTTDHFLNLRLGEVYALGVDMQQPYHVFEGLQDHESWEGPSNGWSGRINIDDWSHVGTGDGMYNIADPTGRWLYNTQEFGSIGRVDLQQRTRIIVDPTKPGSPNAFKNIKSLGGRGGRGGNEAPDAVLYRFNWIAPIAMSPHDPNTLYYGSQFVLRTKDRGDHWDVASPDLTTNNPEKINTINTSIQHCTIVTLAESAAQAGILWVGTDDGKVQLTRDDGAHWTDVTAKVAAAGGPEDAWVTRVAPSHFQPGTAYVTKSRRRQDDFKPYVFRTTDFGATWTKITNGLPADTESEAFTEDTVNPDLVFLGASSGVYASFDRGSNWFSFRSNMAPAPVTDLVVHPREGDLVVGTYGRGTWIVNIVPLRGMAGNFLSSEAALLPVRSFAEREDNSFGSFRLLGDRYPSTPNEANGMTIAYYLKDAPGGAAPSEAPQGGRGGGGRGGFGGGAQCVADGGDGSRPFVTIADSAGKVVCTLVPQSRTGINHVIWSMNMYTAPAADAAPAGGGRGGRGGRGGGGQAAAAPVGEYTFTLNAGGKTYTQKARLVSRAPIAVGRGGGGEPGNDR